jgi:hypothetical protein
MIFPGLRIIKAQRKARDATTDIVSGARMGNRKKKEHNDTQKRDWGSRPN